MDDDRITFEDRGLPSYDDMNLRNIWIVGDDGSGLEQGLFLIRMHDLPGLLMRIK